jgi:hypothetical protein
MLIDEYRVQQIFKGGPSANFSTVLVEIMLPLEGVFDFDWIFHVLMLLLELLLFARPFSVRT